MQRTYKEGIADHYSMQGFLGVQLFKDQSKPISKAGDS